jgi:hypothetical protein
MMRLSPDIVTRGSTDVGFLRGIAPCRFLSRLLLCLLLGTTSIAGAAPVEQDLGRGLVYVRVHKLPADLPASREGPAPACVLDLRFVGADQDAAIALGAWLKFRAGPRSPVFVLVNAGTSAALLRALKTNPPITGVISIGVPVGQFSPDSAIRVSTEEERKAYDAFENGVAITALIADQPNKVRVDEASLAKERPADPAEVRGVTAPAPRPVSPLDVAVQRAVHLHRSLQAFRKI